ncbi:MAG: hypothetical protein H6734_23915 [Alphaproteobacteria bacterium]|nr:hypothetical protein [Alphaproteobacteria bacterium]
MSAHSATSDHSTGSRPKVERWDVHDGDREALSTAIRRSPGAQPPDYAGLVVQKPWGHELQCYADPRCAVWYLQLLPHASTSLHAHPEKDSALIVLSGGGRVLGLARDVLLRELDTLEITRGVFHRFEAGPHGAQVLEIESPPEKTDLVRIAYPNGRLAHGIEGLSSLIAGEGRYGFDLREHALPGVELTEAALLAGRPFSSRFRHALPASLRRREARTPPHARQAPMTWRPANS